MKKIFISVFSFVYEVFIWFTLLWAAALACAFTYMLPKHGVSILVYSILVVLIPKVKKYLKNRRKMN